MTITVKTSKYYENLFFLTYLKGENPEKNLDFLNKSYLSNQ